MSNSRSSICNISLPIENRGFVSMGFTIAVFFVADMFHPVDKFPITLFLNGNMRQGCGRRGPMPMLLSRRRQYYITRTNLLDMSAFMLNPALAASDDEGLTEGMSMPCSPCSRLEGNAGSLNKRRIRCLKKRIHPNISSKPV